jgi:hypothetical protein
MGSRGSPPPASIPEEKCGQCVMPLWHKRHTSTGLFTSSAISSEEWGLWQVMQSPEATGGWTVFFVKLALSWQEKHKAGGFVFSNFAFFDECGLWQTVQPMPIAGWTFFLENIP